MAVDSGSGLKPGLTQFQRPRPTVEENDKKLRDVSELYQRQFMHEMMKAMRSTVQESGLIKVGQAEKIYKEQMDQHYVENWSKKGGIGLADMIYKQLVEKLGPQMGLKQAVAKPHGPIQLDQASNFTGLVKTSQQGNKTSFQYERDPQTGPQAQSLTEIKAPWKGTLLGAKQIQADEYLLEMMHDNGVKSQFVFRGQALPDLRQGSGIVNIEEGQTIGLLSPEARNFFWNVEPQMTNPPEPQQNQTLE